MLSGSTGVSIADASFEINYVPLETELRANLLGSRDAALPRLTVATLKIFKD